MIFNYSILPLLAALASAGVIEQRQRTGSTANELKNGGCQENIFLFARGTTEAGNMGTICGPQTGDGLKKNLGNVAVQGIDYPAAFATNANKGGADPIGIKGMQDMIKKAVTECPQSTLMVGGYSQGAAVVHRAIEGLPEDMTAKIAGAITFGDTQKKQDNGQIPSFPPAKSKIICNNGDMVCVGTLLIRPAHLQYGPRAPEAVAFLTQMAKADKAARKLKKAKA